MGRSKNQIVNLWWWKRSRDGLNQNAKLEADSFGIEELVDLETFEKLEKLEPNSAEKGKLVSAGGVYLAGPKMG